MRSNVETAKPILLFVRRDGLRGKVEPGGANKLYPTVGSMEAKRFIDMGFCFLGVTAIDLGKTDDSLSVS